jgi:type II secretory ATPase GspE/PulE/Tfp pilus assembly ATPase PilB-like protein
MTTNADLLVRVSAERTTMNDRPTLTLSPPLELDNLMPDQIVERLVEHAADLTASDMFFCSNESHVAVFARHLGMLRLVSALPLELGRRCMSYVKTMAGLDATERRRPLDGRWVHRHSSGATYDLRIETVPTLHGEDVAVRLLDRESRLLDTGQLGLAPAAHQILLKLVQCPSGLILVTGPTGSGKTTTLYACLGVLNNGERKINTIEDPIEYALPDIRQSQVNHRIGLDFPDLLRAVIRQGPDVIMVGEVRVPVTAQTVVRAANSGHLVLATLHAPSAAGAVQSMFSLGVHPHHLASCLLAAVAQRLVRTLCPECKAAHETVEATWSVPRMPFPLPEDGRRLTDAVPEPGRCVAYRAVGCPACRETGYAARTGLFELLLVTGTVRRLIMDGRTPQEIHQAAIREGTMPFRQDALLKIAAGITSLGEVFRVVPAEYLVEE